MISARKVPLIGVKIEHKVKPVDIGRFFACFVLEIINTTGQK